MRCPICNAEIQETPFKEWLFNDYSVSRYKCPECGYSFNIYSKEGEEAYTIPKRKL